MNCRGLGQQAKRRDVLHYIRNYKFNIVFLQDTHMTEQTLPFFNSLWRGTAYHSCFSARSRGTCILIDRNTSYSLIKNINSTCGNYVIVICRIQTHVFAFICLYGPNRDSPLFFTELFEHLENIEVDHIVLAGDMNFVIDPERDCLNYRTENNVNARQNFMQLANTFNMIDIWRQFNPNERVYTWTRKNPFQSGRLDMFFVTDHTANAITDANILPGYKTDHNAITITINMQSEAKGNGLWMLNTSHLTNETYIQKMKTCIIETLKQYATPVYQEHVYSDHHSYANIQLTIGECLFYETLLMMLRGESIKFSKQYAKRIRAEEEHLKQKIMSAHEKFNKSGLEQDSEDLELVKSELEELRQPIIEGLIIRSRVAWHEQGERSSKYFLSLEKRNGQSKRIQYIKEGDRIITQTKTIISEFTENLGKKYSESNTNTINETMIAANITKKLTQIDMERLESDLTVHELTLALHRMKKGKTPGANGFPAEFFRTFWNEIGPFLHRAFVASLKRNQPFPSHREGIIKMIPKQGKSPHSLKGWRPITLLNVDYKIVSSAIANRFRTVIDQIIGPSQTAYISGRFLGENTRLLFDTINYVKENKMKAIIVAADFESAFESVSWNYLRSVLVNMNFGHQFLKMIDLMYLNPKNYSRIMINGHLGSKMPIGRGIRQGDPSSGYLFNIAVEVLAGLINKSQKIQGINISPTKQIRISQYADDTILLLDGSIASVTGALDELIKFAELSGLKVNVDKTSCLPIGSLQRSRIPSEFRVKVVDELKILGIYFSANTKEITKRNLREKINSIRQDIAQWKRRNLTPVGKICIIKSLLLSKIVHLFIALPNPEKEDLKLIESLLYNFVWQNKGDKIKRTKLVQKYEKDGLKMVDLKAFIDSMKLTWLKRLMTSEADWTHVAYKELPDVRKLLTYGKAKLSLVKSKVTNSFYRNLIDALIRFSVDYKHSCEEILSETIWCSDHTKFSKTVIHEWNNKGLRFIGDLFDKKTGNVYKKEEIEHSYHIQMTFLCYETLVRSLPQCLRNSPKNFENPNIPFKINAVMNERKFSKYSYDIFVNSLAKKHATTNKRIEDKWKNDIGNHIIGTTKKLIDAALSTYFIFLHYRIVMRTFPTNKLLYVMQVEPSNMCSFCQQSIESIVHLFWDCPKAKIFIKEVLSHIKQKYNKTMTMNKTKWFLLDDTDDIEVLIITLCKYVIHKARLDKSNPSINVMLNVLKREAQKEYISFKSKNKINEFQTKWGSLEQILNQ